MSTPSVTITEEEANSLYSFEYKGLPQALRSGMSFEDFLNTNYGLKFVSNEVNVPISNEIIAPIEEIKPLPTVESKVSPTIKSKSPIHIKKNKREPIAFEPTFFSKYLPIESLIEVHNKGPMCIKGKNSFTTLTRSQLNCSHKERETVSERQEIKEIKESTMIKGQNQSSLDSIKRAALLVSHPYLKKGCTEKISKNLNDERILNHLYDDLKCATNNISEVGKIHFKYLDKDAISKDAKKGFYLLVNARESLKNCITSNGENIQDNNVSSLNMVNMTITEKLLNSGLPEYLNWVFNGDPLANSRSSASKAVSMSIPKIISLKQQLYEEYKSDYLKDKETELKRKVKEIEITQSLISDFIKGTDELWSAFMFHVEEELELKKKDIVFSRDMDSSALTPDIKFNASNSVDFNTPLKIAGIQKLLSLFLSEVVRRLRQKTKEKKAHTNMKDLVRSQVEKATKGSNVHIYQLYALFIILSHLNIV